MNGKLFGSFLVMNIDENKIRYDLSDHCLIEVKMNFNLRRGENVVMSEEVEYYSTNQEYKDRYLRELEECLLLRTGANYMANFDESMKNAAECVLKNSHFKKTRRDDKVQPIWFTSEMRENIKIRKMYSKRWRTSENEQDKIVNERKYKEQKFKVKEMVKEGITSYEKKINESIKENNNRNKLWENINMLRGNQKEKELVIIYDENGNIIEKEIAKNLIVDFWSEVYRKHENNINIVWNDNEKEEYVRRLRNDPGVRVEFDRVVSQEDKERNDFMNRLRNIAGIGGITRESNLVTSEDEVRYIYVPPAEADLYQAIAVNNPLKEYTQPMNSMIISVDDVKKQLKKLKSNKQPGPNKLKGEIYKWLIDSDYCLAAFVDALNEINRTGSVPEQWKVSKTVLIPKTNKPTVKQLRPICLTDVSYKIYMALCRDKLVDHLKENSQLSEFQAGFCAGRRVEDNIFLLKYCIDETRKLKKELYVGAIDFEKAFDSLDRGKIIATLMKYKCDPNIVESFSELYRNDKTQVYINNELISEVEITSGIRQGCTGSPLLFVVVLNHIISKLLNCGKGFRNDYISIPCLFFADDGLLLAENLIQARSIINLTMKTASELGLKINKNKSYIMKIGGSDELQPICEIKVVSEIRYLGIDLCNKKDMYKKYKERKLKEIKKMCNMTYSMIARSCNKVLVGKSYWKSVVLSSVLYGNAVVTWTKTDIQNMQRNENNVWRKILGGPGYTPVVALRGEIGASTMEVRDLKAKLKYAKHILKGENDLLLKVFKRMFEDGRDKWIRSVKGLLRIYGSIRNRQSGST